VGNAPTHALTAGKSSSVARRYWHAPIGTRIDMEIEPTCPRTRTFVLLYALLLMLVLAAPIGTAHPKSGYLREVPSAATMGGMVDGLLNIAIFVPLGWGLRRLIRFRSHGLLAALIVGLVGAHLSVVMEVFQHFVPLRYSSITDVVSNTVGAIVGSVVAQRHL